MRVPGVVFKPFFKNGGNDRYLSFHSNFIQKSAIGCGLAHIQAWERVAKNKDTMGLVLEDDAVINENFSETFKKAILDVPKDFDILFLGCTAFCNPEKDMSLFEKIFVKQKKDVTISDNVFIPSRPLALHAYILSSKGAEKLLNYFQKDKLTYHVDRQMLLYYPDMKVYAVEPKAINQRFIEGRESNNTTKYPSTLSRAGSLIAFQEIDASYLMGIGHYEIGRVVLCGWVTFFVILGTLFTNIESMTAFFLVFHSIEMLFSKEIHINHAIVYYTAMLVGFILRRNLIG
jgi:GR25 family glycosyltransferase involved in LPS biosynthesis